MEIREFKIGDVITRYERSKTNDGSMRGDRLEFLGLDGGIIHYKQLDGILKGNSYNLPLEDWSEGWQFVGAPKNPTGLKYYRRLNKRKRHIKNI